MTPLRLFQRSNDDATDRRLGLLIGLVVVLALTSAILSAWSAAHLPAPHPLALALLYIVTVIAYRFRIYVRMRSGETGETWGEIPSLVGLVLLPTPWVVLCVAGAVATVKVMGRKTTTLQKAMFSVAKEVLIVSAAGAVLSLAGSQPSLVDPQVSMLAVVLAFVAFWFGDYLVFYPVIALASGSNIFRLVRHDLSGRLVTSAARLITVIYVVEVLVHGGDLALLAFVPLVVTCLHLWHSRRLRTREERNSWRQLADTTDELSSVDLEQVLHVAAVQAAQIFSADEVEIDLSADGFDRVVRAGARGVSYDGPGPRRFAGTITAELETRDRSYRAGVLVLTLRGKTRLSEFDQYKLKTYASALCTAIRNASAYAELQRLNEQNAFDAAHDPLTGLANRRELYERAEVYFQGGSRDGLVALLLIDLNHFKEVNDTLGHAAGDEVLRAVARRLGAAAAPGDLVARLGGDEFAVLLVNLRTPALATHRAEQMLGALEGSLEVEGMQITVEAAGGIALAAGTGGINELMRRADIAMYQAKRAGQQTASYAHAQDTADVERLVLGGELQRAVTEHEFVVDFQPIVDLGTGEVISVEALARWHHPEHGYLTPMQFLETVERSGQLPAFADAVLDQALAAADGWREAGFDLPIAVNVSPRSLLDPRFPEMVLARIGHHRVPPEKVVLELAETLTISQLDVVGRALNELSEAGIRLALDDFGTGVSPLSVLSHIPVHELKIDREFVGSMETSSEAAAVIRSTVDLARSLHLTVIAEGVESEPQRHALFEMGCVAGQGHLFARAMPSTRLLGTLQRGFGGRPGVLAAALHDAGAVVRMPRRRSSGSGKSSLPHLPA
ncbi:bifunctional diguanylate cyclase/phosphodiesterase [Actinoplanes sp. TBRC 11911]|nr:bifunctional diguanylate cyclase/phosphodiesterase [Actinoplanes sp. TBRC 11911]